MTPEQRAEVERRIVYLDERLGEASKPKSWSMGDARMLLDEIDRLAGEVARLNKVMDLTDGLRIEVLRQRDALRAVADAAKELLSEDRYREMWTKTPLLPRIILQNLAREVGWRDAPPRVADGEGHA